MSYPEFFAAVPRLTLRDPLAELLGAAENGLIEYGYTDAVKLAGHSCPTVAGAYLMTFRALAKLYPDCPPERGAIRVELHAAQADGTAGVTAAVAGLLTGAAGEGGFKGVGGRYSRRNLLSFAAPLEAELGFARIDSGARVTLTYHPEVVPAPPELQGLMPKLLAGAASAAEKTEFGRLWQMRVKRILIDHFDDPELVVCREIPE
jgi:FmdE, Molybdenum formylmethanofuran dehydrogenase operon